MRYMTHNNTKRFVNILPDIEKLYNSSYHSSIKCSPNEVTTKNQTEIHYNLYGNGDTNLPNPKYKIGDNILIASIKKVFDKGYAPNFQSQVYTIHTIRDTNPRVYTLRDSDNKDLPGSYYESEMIKITHQ
jgi:hypothetical protein